MGTLGRSTRNGKTAPPRIERAERAHPAAAKLANALREYKKAAEQQAATAQILRALSRSTTDPQPVFEAIVEHAHRLTGALYSVLYRYDGEKITVAADRHVSRAASRAQRSSYPRAPSRDYLVGRTILEGRTTHSPDLPNDARFPGSRHAVQKYLSRRALVAVPLMRDGVVIGAIGTGRAEAKPFTKKEIKLLETFADQAVIAIEKVRLLNETREALEHQKASGDILRIVASSVENTDPVFAAITSAGMRLFPGVRVSLSLARDGAVHYVSHSGISKERRAEVAKLFPRPLDRKTVIAASIVDGRIVHVPDIATVRNKYPVSAQTSQVSGWTAMLAVPLIEDGKAIGCLGMSRATAGAFSDKQIALAQNFADQAVIAIRNARLFNQTKEGLERQTATAEILKVISGSPTDVQPVFDAIASSALQLVGGFSAAVTRRIGDELHLVALTGTSVSGDKALKDLFPQHIQSDRHRVLIQAVVTKAPAYVTDTEARDVPRMIRDLARARGYRSALAVPLIHESTAIGTISVTRREPGPFANHQIDLMKTFAAQAVIAIENVRLFNETKEALERQTATAEILKVIASSPSDVQPVFNAIAASAKQLLGALTAVVTRVVGDMQHLAAWTTTGKSGDESLRGLFPARVGDLHSGRAIATLAPAIRTDTETDPSMSQELRDHARVRGYRSQLAVPMVREGVAIGAIAVARGTPGPFSDHQIGLLQTFADQAVIAIENVRLFNETKEALERQTATAEILKVISDSPTNVQPVLEAIVQSAARLFESFTVVILMREGDFLQRKARAGPDRLSKAEREELESQYPLPLDPKISISARAAVECRTVEVLDTEAGHLSEVARRIGRLAKHRSVTAVPLVRESQAIGTIVLTRPEPGFKLSDKQLTLVRTFADQAVIAIENVRLFNETKESLEQQTAISEVLRVTSSSPTDVKPVLDAVAVRAAKICDASDARILLVEEGNLRHYAGFGNVPFSIQLGEAVPLSRDTVIGRAVIDRAPIHLEDFAALPAEEFPASRKWQERSGWRTCLCVPLLREDHPLGVISLRRLEVRPFTDKQVSLVKTFADQAAIAIENARLFNETKEALDQQTATAEILRVISSSPDDMQPVFDSILEHAMRLCDAGLGTIGLYDGKTYRHRAQRGGSAEYVKRLLDEPFVPHPDGTLGRMIAGLGPVHIPDYRELPAYREREPRAVATVELGGARTYLAVPMLKDGQVLGGITIRRTEVRPFSQKQIDLLSTFANQAVIAIENARLFNETKEALERQTATAEILKVISSTPTDVQPVFDAIVRSAVTLCDAQSSNLQRFDGERMHLVAAHNFDTEAHTEFAKIFPMRPERRWIGSRAVLDRTVVQVADLFEEPNFPAHLARKSGWRCVLAVPMLRDSAPIGAIVVARKRPEPFDDKQVALLRTFADQAVIAIENVRLFNETKESLERQTATADILAVISRSQTDVQPVFETIARNAVKLCSAIWCAVFRVEDGSIDLAAHHGFTAEALANLRQRYPGRVADMDSGSARCAREREIVQLVDVENLPGIPEARRQLARIMGFRAQAFIPMLRAGACVGVIGVTRPEAEPFPHQQIALLQTFADQAVIAIENVRLFNETKEALEQQTAIGEILRVISSSPADVKPVLDAVAMRAARICQASDVRIYLVDGDQLRHSAGFGDMPMPDIGTMRPIDRGLVLGRSVIEGRPVHVEDIRAVLDEFPTAAHFGFRSGQRTILAIPLMREGKALGAMLMRRLEVRPFTEKQIALLKTFADQAAIAIENVRLFNATKEALEQQTATTEVLNVISSSITDARPVFDAIARSVLKLYGARNVGLVVRAGETIDRVGYAVSDSSADDGTQALYPIPLDEGSLSGRAILRGDVVHIRDVETEEGLSEHSRAITRKTGARSVLVAPMNSMGTPTGALTIARHSPGGFSEREVEMIRTFANQAVIAMENVRLFREIEEKSAQLKEASEHKSQFLASMSHELRTPLNALLGFNELILGDVYGEVPGDMKPPLEQMQSSGKHLLRLINNVLDLAKIEAGRMELALADYSVHDIVESVRSTLRPLAQEKGLEFGGEVPADIPVAHGDPGRIMQCLMNLAGNSLKFTKAGKVEISVALSNGQLRYCVADTGIGIPPQKIGGLFTEFKQTDATVASEFGGTGLGLAISRKFVEMHGGRIWAESEPGRGSVFTFEVPLRARAQ